jgi:hypothetical protein
MRRIFLAFFTLTTTVAISQPFEFSYSKSNYNPIDTTKNEVVLKGVNANGWNSTRVNLSFEFPFLSTKHSSVVFDNTGTILLDRGGNLQLDARIEMLNTKYYFDSTSYIVKRETTINGEDIFELEFSNMAFERDKSLKVNFKCRLYESGVIEVLFGENNIDRKLTGDTSLYVGLDTNNFTWTYFVGGDPNSPKAFENDDKAFLEALPESGTIYRFTPKTTNIDKKQTQKISIYPVPTQNTLHIIGLQPEVDISIFNDKGQKVVCTLNINGTLDVSSLAPGIYLVQVRSVKAARVLQFIKQ